MWPISGGLGHTGKRRLAGGLLLGLVLGAVVAFAFMPAALTHKEAGGVELAYGRAMVSLAARIDGPGPQAPPPNRNLVTGLDPKVTPNAGRNAYTGLCADCHGEEGDGQGPLGSSTFPPATDLTSQEPKRRTDAELRWIIRNGLGFSAMPGFGDSLPEDDVSSLVMYIRALQAGQGQPIKVPTPTAEQFGAANSEGDATQRGAAAYFAQGCQLCHGAIGDAPDELGIQDISQLRDTIRRGRPGMPVFSSSKLSDAQIADIQAYLENVPQTNGER
ncbi:MAG TPA: c-type cytochrome [Chloroflexota bacterium]|nr:c-type cytochrome [Chloroflexota bacterium]